MSILIIAGGGKFGRKAVDFAKKNKYKTILVDKNPTCFCSSYATQKFEALRDFYSKIEEIEAGEVFFLIHDISIIYELLVKFEPTYVIPVIPIHLSALIIKNFLREKININLTPNEDITIKFVSSANKELLLTYSLEEGVAYLSYAKIDEVCPDNCFGPENFCPNFNREKPITITSYLKNYFDLHNSFRVVEDEDLKVIVIYESTQLMPGLGGLKGIVFNNIFKNLEEIFDKITTQKFSLFIVTTCNCHAVINFYRNFIS